ncbi:hypothetical protein [Brevibacillus laterosporus]|uniref:Uncharacterized protein n=2 Tax=Brevibacillus laterosporus TaxID=1465 RepID=A0AAP3DE10_BRELA|nr:hypothetical protein [Brevibacillus laterosporus]MCR8979509.1 hypothetical protein [Brevibacillus laterosporus]MCZ0806664.1 hypothetical protein [Brevibacillus laterosporus]MCZ0825112.1 hypothetical protein [Brevibacillus laterosporus]MCZ0852050.1 hypothetical protein [Brevibacillus laterosporus]
MNMVEQFNTALEKYIQKRIIVAKMELDYELAVLFDALEIGDQEQVQRSKAKLAELREELLVLEK